MGFESGRVTTIEAIPWLGNARGIAYEGTLGAEQDGELDRLKDAARMASGPVLCPDDALDKMGTGLQVERFTGELDASYRARQLLTWSTKLKAGSPQSIIDSIRAWGIPDVAIDQDYEGDFWIGDWYTRFRTRLGPDFGVTGIRPGLIGVDFIIGTSILGTTATASQKAQIVRQILLLKDAGSYATDIALVWSGDLIGVDFIIGTSTISGDMLKWTIGPLIGVDFIIGSSKIGGYIS